MDTPIGLLRQFLSVILKFIAIAIGVVVISIAFLLVYGILFSGATTEASSNSVSELIQQGGDEYNLGCDAVANGNAYFEKYEWDAAYSSYSEASRRYSAAEQYYSDAKRLGSNNEYSEDIQTLETYAHVLTLASQSMMEASLLASDGKDWDQVLEKVHEAGQYMDLLEETASTITAQTSSSTPISEDYLQISGLLLATPKQDEIKSYLSNYGLDASNTHAYLLFQTDGVYLVITENTDVNVDLTPANVAGTAYNIDFNSARAPEELRSLQPKGVLIADSVRVSEPISATVEEINQNPSKFAFKRVKIRGTYLVTSWKVGYSEYNTQHSFGNGILADSFPASDDTEIIETLDPYQTTWQVRYGDVVGTVLYPTDEVIQVFQYSTPQAVSEIQSEIPPALLVEQIQQAAIQHVQINDLRSNPSRYDGQVVRVRGYALGADVPVKEVAAQVSQNLKYVPVDVNIRGVAVADSPSPTSWIALAGLNSELVSGTQYIYGLYEFDIAVTFVDGVYEPLYFVIAKKELPFAVPTEVPQTTYTDVPTVIPTPYQSIGYIYVWSTPTGASVYVDGTYLGVTSSSQYLPIAVYSGSHQVTVYKNGYEEYSTSVTASSSNYPKVDAYLSPISTPTPTWTYVAPASTPVTTAIPTPSPTPSYQYPRSMYAEGDVNPEVNPMMYYQGNAAWDYNDRSIGADLGSARQISSLTITNAGSYQWSRIDATDVSIYYSDDNQYYSQYTGSFTYYASASGGATISGLDICARYIKLHQSKYHDKVWDFNCVTCLSDGAGGSPQIY
ncbi:hypothetical protein ES707_08849 [subsurface metagenome]